MCEVLQIFLAHVWCHNVCVPYFWHIFGVTICELVCVTRCPTMALWTAHMSWSRTASSDDRCNVNILPPEHSHAYIPASRSLFFVFHPESGSQNIPSPTMVCLLLVIPENFNFYVQSQNWDSIFPHRKCATSSPKRKRTHFPP